MRTLNYSFIPFGFIVLLSIITSCGSNQKSEEAASPYQAANDSICDCYRQKHEEMGIDYDAELEKALNYWKNDVSVLKSLAFEDIIRMLEDLENDKIAKLGDSIYLRPENHALNYDLLRTCVKQQAEVNTFIAQQVAMMDVIVLGPTTDKSVMLAQIKELRKVIQKMDETQKWNRPFLLRGATYAYANKIRTLHAIAGANELVEEEPYYEEPHPPPPVEIAPPPIEEIHIEENTEELPIHY